MEQVFADLKAAVAAFDPGAIDLVDLLLSAAPEGGDLFHTLSQTREHLDNFSFAEAETLLAKVAPESR